MSNIQKLRELLHGNPKALELLDKVAAVPVVGEPVAFGKGDKVIKTGRYGGVPAVFIAAAKHPGKVGSDASRERQPNDSLSPGEIVLTFPTDEQADAVADAICCAAIPRARLDEPLVAEKRVRELEATVGKLRSLASDVCLATGYSNARLAVFALNAELIRLNQADAALAASKGGA